MGLRGRQRGDVVGEERGVDEVVAQTHEDMAGVVDAAGEDGVVVSAVGLLEVEDEEDGVEVGGYLEHEVVDELVLDEELLGDVGADHGFGGTFRSAGCGDEAGVKPLVKD